MVVMIVMTDFGRMEFRGGNHMDYLSSKTYLAIDTEFNLRGESAGEGASHEHTIVPKT